MFFPSHAIYNWFIQTVGQDRVEACHTQRKLWLNSFVKWNRKEQNPKYIIRIGFRLKYYDVSPSRSLAKVLNHSFEFETFGIHNIYFDSGRKWNTFKMSHTRYSYRRVRVILAGTRCWPFDFTRWWKWVFVLWFA